MKSLLIVVHHEKEQVSGIDNAIGKTHLSTRETNKHVSTEYGFETQDQMHDAMISFLQSKIEYSSLFVIR